MNRAPLQAVPAEPALAGGPFLYAGRHAASWPSIVAGSIVAISVSLILLTLGAGLGLATLSSWADPGGAGSGFAIGAAVWLVVTQWLSAALGGYITGRLRGRWVGTHGHEVFFRDTAHGLVTWAVATLLVVALAGGSVRALLSGGVPAATVGAVESYGAYGLDKLFRPAGAAPDRGGADDREARLEAQHIMTHALSEGRVSDIDRGYLTTMVASRTGLSGSDARARVDDWVAASLSEQSRVKAAAEAARRNLAAASIYTALSLLIGAFVACVAAALGGRLRDLHP